MKLYAIIEDSACCIHLQSAQFEIYNFFLRIDDHMIKYTFKLGETPIPCSTSLCDLGVPSLKNGYSFPTCKT